MIELLTRWSETFWTGMALHLWQSTLVLAVLVIAARWLRDAPARWLAAFWWIAVLKLFLPLQLLGSLTRGWIDRWSIGGPTAAEPTGGVSIVTMWFYPAALRGGEGPERMANPWFLVLAVAWAVVVVMLAILPRSRRKGDPSPEVVALDPARTHKLELAADAAGIPLDEIVAVSGSRLPAVHGLLRTRIVLPRAVIEELSVDELKAILLHEQAHRRRRDPLRAVFLRAAAVGFFFYPPVWWLLRRVHDATEMACDEAVVRAGVDAAEYRRSLARILTLQLEPAAGAAALFGFGRSTVAARLRRLTRAGRFVVMRKHRLVLAVALCVVLGASFLPLAPRAVAGAGLDDLTRLAAKDVPVVLNFEEAKATLVFDAIERVARPLRFELEPDVRNMLVSVDLDRVPLHVALMKIAQGSGLRYEVLDPNTVRVKRRPLLAGQEGVSTPRSLPEFRVQPHYPEALRAAGIEGNVMLQAVLTESGDVSEIELLGSSQPDYPELAASAIEAVRQWRYEPAEQNGVPVEVYFTISIDFKLD